MSEQKSDNKESVSFWLKEEIINNDGEDGKSIAKDIYVLWDAFPISGKHREPSVSIIEGMLKMKKEVIENPKANNIDEIILELPRFNLDKKRKFKVRKELEINSYYITEILKTISRTEAEVRVNSNGNNPILALINFLSDLPKSELLQSSEFKFVLEY